MNFNYFAFFSFIFSTLISLVFVSTTKISNNSIILRVSNDFKIKTRNELSLITNLVRNDILQGNIRSARNQIARSIDTGTVNNFVIQSKNDKVSDTLLIENTDFSIFEIPIYFGEDGVHWGSILYRVSNSEIIKIKKELNYSLILNSLMILSSLLVFLFILYFLIMFYSNKIIVDLKRTILGLPLAKPQSRKRKFFGPIYDEFEKIYDLTQKNSQMIFDLKYSSESVRIARQVSHDIQSPLGALGAVAQSSQNLPPHLKSMIERSVLRITDITRQILEKTKSQNLTNIDYNMIKTISHEIIEEKKILGIKVDSDMNPFNGAFLGNLIGLKTVISNILNNAYECTNSLPNAKIKITIAQNTEGLINIEISDNGPGIKPELLSLILIGQYTSKPSGSSIGLSSAKNIIESWGGTLLIKSSPTLGTTVTLQFKTVNKENL